MKQEEQRDSVYILRAIRDAITPTERLTLREWMERRRKISAGNAEPGDYNFARTPYIREIADELDSKSLAKKIVVMKTSQLGLTELAISWALHTIECEPSTLYYMIAKLEESKKSSKTKFNEAMKAHPNIRQKFIEDNEGKHGNTINLKQFAGGYIQFVGGLKIDAYKTHSVKKIIVDEADEIPADIEGQGDPISLLKDRQNTFYDSKIFILSTPTEHIEGHESKEKKSIVYSEIQKTDRRRYLVPCPYCKHKQPLEFERLIHTRSGEGKVKIIGYECASCKKLIQPSMKEQMLLQGKWEPTQKPKEDDAVGFELNALYSPEHWKSWKSCAEDYYSSLQDAEKEVHFYHNVLGIPYQAKYKMIKAEVLFDRREEYETKPMHETIDESERLPEGIYMLLAGADVQKNRIEVLVKGYGLGMETWTIEHYILPAKQDTAMASDPVWLALLKVMNFQYRLHGGQIVSIERLGIDVSYNSMQVITFTRKLSPFVMPIKGTDRGSISYVRSTKLRADILEVNTNNMKSNFFSRLEILHPEGRGEGQAHFPKSISNIEHYRQIVSEARTINPKTGKEVWEKTRKRNEVLDINIYADALAYYLRLDTNTEEDVDNYLLSL